MKEKNYELECLMRSIKEVEMAKSKKPDLYAEALSALKGEAKAIMSIEDLKARREELSKEDKKPSEEIESDDESEKKDD